jgi:hypothetical protein
MTGAKAAIEIPEQIGLDVETAHGQIRQLRPRGTPPTHRSLTSRSVRFSDSYTEGLLGRQAEIEGECALSRVLAFPRPRRTLNSMRFSLRLTAGPKSPPLPQNGEFVKNSYLPF